MQFVNVTSKNVYTKFVGMLHPGEVSSGRGRECRILEETLSTIVNSCKEDLGIRLTEREAELLNKLVSLDEKGGGFKPDSIPEEIRNDPTGAKRAAESRRAVQQKELDDMAKKNEDAARREAEINGETDPRAKRRPVGPANMEGEKVDPSKLKSGFEAIMEENRKIAEGKSDGKKDVNEILDPIGAHMKGADVGDSNADEPEKAIGKDPVKVEQAKNLSDDGTRTADAEMPPPAEPANKMDKVAADVAQGLATLGPVDSKSKDKQSRAGKSEKAEKAGKPGRKAKNQ